MMTMQENINVPYPNPESKDELYTFLKWCSDNGSTIEWNNWRIRNLLTNIDLSKIDLSNLKLDFIDFKATDLSFCDLSNTSLEGATFDIANLEGTNLGNVNLAEASLRNVSMLGANLVGSNLILANFEASDLTGAHMSNTNLTGSNMDRTCLKGVSLENANIRNVSFKNSDLRIALMVGVDLSTADISNVNFTGANLSGIDFTSVDISTINLTGANLTGANLTGMDLSTINLTGTILSEADLTQVNLSGVSLVNQEMVGTNLTSADLNGANLTEAKLVDIKGLGADFSNATLVHANLSAADLTGAIMQSANLESANLEGANLEEANLRAANLTDTDLYGADLTDTNLTGATLTGTHLEEIKEEAPKLSQTEIVKESLKEMESVNKIIDQPTSIIAIEEKLKEISKKNIEIEKAKLEQSTSIGFNDDLSQEPEVEAIEEINEEENNNIEIPQVEPEPKATTKDIRNLIKDINSTEQKRKEQEESIVSNEQIESTNIIEDSSTPFEDTSLTKDDIQEQQIVKQKSIQDIKDQISSIDIDMPTEKTEEPEANVEEEVVVEQENINKDIEITKEEQPINQKEESIIAPIKSSETPITSSKVEQPTDLITSIEQFVRTVETISVDTKPEKILSIVRSIAFKLDYQDTDLSGEITMPYIDMMKGYQNNVYLTYLSFAGRREELTYLTKREKNALELKFKLDENNSVYVTPYKIDYIVQNMIECAIGPKEILLSVCAIVGYLPTKQIKKCIKEKLEDKDDTVNDTFVRVSRRLKNSEAKDKKLEVILSPVADNDSITLKTAEDIFTNKSLSAKTTSKRIEEIEIEDEFLVDGVKGLSSSKPIFYLVNDEDTYSIKVGLEQSKIKEVLLKSLRKTVSATISIEKVNDEVVRQSIIEID
jgi:uncharacterized protein YjbI with pentapeptide repeats